MVGLDPRRDDGPTPHRCAVTHSFGDGCFQAHPAMVPPRPPEEGGLTEGLLAITEPTLRNLPHREGFFPVRSWTLAPRTRPPTEAPEAVRDRSDPVLSLSGAGWESSCQRFRGEPAISGLDWHITPRPPSSQPIATDTGSIHVIWRGRDRPVSGRVSGTDGRRRRIHSAGKACPAHPLADPLCRRYAGDRIGPRLPGSRGCRISCTPPRWFSFSVPSRYSALSLSGGRTPCPPFSAGEVLGRGSEPLAHRYGARLLLLLGYVRSEERHQGLSPLVTDGLHLGCHHG